MLNVPLVFQTTCKKEDNYTDRQTARQKLSTCNLISRQKLDMCNLKKLTDRQTHRRNFTEEISVPVIVDSLLVKKVFSTVSSMKYSKKENEYEIKTKNI